jgi:hypothetical protein
MKNIAKRMEIKAMETVKNICKAPIYPGYVMNT